MEFLDYDRHGPDEYEGKCFTVDGRVHLVGRFLGSGGFQIVHEVVDARAGHADWVLKVPRTQEESPEFIAALEELSGILQTHLEIAHISASVTARPTRALAGAYPKVSESDVANLLAFAEACLASADPTGAIKLSIEVLTTSAPPASREEALDLAADAVFAIAAPVHLAAAARLFLDAANDFLYQDVHPDRWPHLLRLLARVGIPFAGLAVDAFIGGARSMESTEARAELCIACGLLDDAGDLVDQLDHVTPEAPRGSVREQLVIRRVQRTASEPSVRAAVLAGQEDDPVAMLEHLRQARRAAPDDVYLAVNEGIACSALGRLDEAVALLLQSLGRFPVQTASSLLATAASATACKDHATATTERLLSDAAGVIRTFVEEQQDAGTDLSMELLLPSRVVWINPDMSTVEAPPTAIARALVDAARCRNKGSDEDLAWLADTYEPWTASTTGG